MTRHFISPIQPHLILVPWSGHSREGSIVILDDVSGTVTFFWRFTTMKSKRRFVDAVIVFVLLCLVTPLYAV